MVAVPLGVAALAHAAAEEDQGRAGDGREERGGCDRCPRVLVNLVAGDVLVSVGVEVPGSGIEVKAGARHRGVKAGHVLGGVAEGDDLDVGRVERQCGSLVAQKDDALTHGGSKGLGLVGNELLLGVLGELVVALVEDVLRHGLDRRGNRLLLGIRRARRAAAGKAGQDGGRGASQDESPTSHVELHVLPFFPRPNVGRNASARGQKVRCPGAARRRGREAGQKRDRLRGREGKRRGIDLLA